MDRLGGEDAGLDRVVDALQRGTLTKPPASPPMTMPGACGRERPDPPSGIAFAPQAKRLPPSRTFLDQRVELELLQQVVDGEPGVGVVEPDHEADRDLRRLALAVHAVDPRAAELLVLALDRSGQPSVWMTLSSGFDLPDLLDAERPDLRVVGRQVEALSAAPVR